MSAAAGEGASGDETTRSAGTIDDVVRSRSDAALGSAVFLVAILLFCWRCLEMAGWFVEDAYINFRYVANVLNGHGLVWNVGGDPVEGYTSPLFLGILVAAAKSGLSLPAAVLGVGVLSVGGLAALFAACVRRESGRLAPLAMMVLGLWLVDSRLAIHVTAGLETVLYMFLLAADFFVAVRFAERPGRGRALGLAAMNVLCLLGRPDAAPFIAAQAVVLVAASIHARRRHGDGSLLKWTFVSYAAALAVGIGYLGAKYLYFGYVLPNPFYIKANNLRTLWGLPSVRRYLSFLARVAVFAPALLFVDYGRLREWWRRPVSKLKAALLLVPPAVFLVYYTTIIPEVNYSNRFEYPTYWFVALAVGLVVSIGAPFERVETWLSRRLPRAAVIAVAWIAVLALVGVMFRATWGEFRGREIVESRYYRPIGDALARTGLGPKASIVFDSAGVVPYRSEFTHIDPVGLTDNVLSGRKPITAEQREAYIWGRDPDVYIGPEIPATAGAAGYASDPLIESGFVREVLLAPNRFLILKGYLKAYGGLSPEARREVLHMRMRELRDRWDYLGEIPYPVQSATDNSTFVYVRRGSPHHDELVRALEALFTSGVAFHRPPNLAGPSETRER